MKKFINKGIVTIMLLGVVFSMTFCDSKEYLIDGGKANPYYDGTVMEYLESRPDLFTKLVQVIKIAGMEDIFQSDEITFFAPTDFSIDGSIRDLNRIWHDSYGHDEVTEVSQISADTWKEYLSMYIVKGKYRLKDVAQVDTTKLDAYPGQAFIAYNGKSMNMGVVYGDAGGVKYAGYRQLLYSLIYDVQTMDMQNAYVATSDIQPTNGVVHVIRFLEHCFGFEKYAFGRRAIENGISDN